MLIYSTPQELRAALIEARLLNPSPAPRRPRTPLGPVLRLDWRAHRAVRRHRWLDGTENADYVGGHR